MSTSWRMSVSPATGCSEHSSRATTLRGRFQRLEAGKGTQLRLAAHCMMIAFRPFHSLDAAVVAVAPPHDAGVRPMSPQALRHMFDDRSHLRDYRAVQASIERRRGAHAHLLEESIASVGQIVDVMRRNH